ncbi:oligosaccharide repeat unit polymerase [uncultured Alistipes sp.]|jgi:membrane protein|uniref:oligosaccharide repeat unit polymerase n=1 Tax=uncultured Alistipes sp. TaxID=538949 RepID=UPI0025ED2102|nr:oligosaccharide repeat unit polymerase [uncultured Alistipes sp.]
MQNIYPFLYAGVLTLWFIFYYRKNKCFNGGAYLLLLWAVSAILGAFYELDPIWDHNNPITVMPYVYLLVINYFVFKPLLQFKTQKIEYISGDYRLIEKLLIVIILVNLPPLVENLFHTMQGAARGALFDINAFNERYEDAETTLYYMSSISKKLSQIANAMRLVLIVSTFYYFALDKSKRSPIITWGIVLCYLNLVSYSLNTGSRATIVMYALIAGYIFLLFKSLYSDKTRKKIYKMTLLIGSLMIIVFTTITLTRFADMQYDTRVDRTLGRWLMSYAGEGHGNFNADLWDVEKFNNWDPVTEQIGVLFGKKTKELQTNFNDYQSWKEVQFHTYVGTYYRAYGPVTAFIVMVAMGLLFTLLIKNKRVLRFSDLLIVAFYAKIPILGFTYFAYLFDKWQIIIMPIVILFFRFKEKTKW